MVYDKTYGECCLKTKNHENKEIIFTEKQRLLKSAKHPETRNPDFINGRVKDAIRNPDFIYGDLDKPQRRIAIYKLEFKIGKRSIYTKVVVNIEQEPYFVITAYRPDYIKERNKTKLLYGKDN